MAKLRLDLLLVERGLAESRSQAAAMIMAGQVQTEDGHRLSKPGHLVGEDEAIVVAAGPRYVSRAGEKLASVAEALNLDFSQKVVLDVGSSTGGFTDYALQQGARKVYAVDVGNFQLHPRIRDDERVEVFERMDIREMTTQMFSEKPDLAVIDVSFISLKLVMAQVAALVKEEGQIVAMMKPQFEAGKLLADKYHGVIKDPEIRQGVIAEFRTWLAQNQFEIRAEADSAVAGAKGNLEHFFVLTLKGEPKPTNH